MISTAARSTELGTGAPADKSNRTAASAARCRDVRSPAVAITFANAAGDANTNVAPIASAASASATARREPGAVTLMSGTTDGTPIAGPYKAKGANAATNRSRSL